MRQPYESYFCSFNTEAITAIIDFLAKMAIMAQQFMAIKMTFMGVKWKNGQNVITGEDGFEKNESSKGRLQKLN